MGNLGENQSPEIQTVFVETNLETRLVVPILKDESISSFKDRFCEEHHEIFPEIGEINIYALKVKRRGDLYHLSNRMNLGDAFDAISRNWFLYVDAAKVEKENLLAIVVADQKCSNPGLVEGNQEIGVDSVLVEEGLETKVAVAEKTKREKRKVKSLDVKKGVTDDVNQSAKVEKEDLLANVVAHQKCSNPGLVERNQETGIDSELKEGLDTQVDVAEKTTTGKRKVKSSDGTKSRKKRLIDDADQYAKVEKEDLLAIVVADQSCSNPGLVEEDKEIGIDSVLEEGFETELAVAEKTTTGKRKVKSSDGKKRVIDDADQYAKVEKEDLLAIVVAVQSCSNPGLVEGNKEIGIDSVFEEGCETEVAVAEKTTREKRKGKSSDGKKSRKKRVVDDVNQSAKVEKEDLLAIVVADQNCSNPCLVEGNKETGIDSVLEEGFETEVVVAEKTTTGKRKAKSSDGKKSRKKRVIDDVNQSPAAVAHDENNEVEAVVVAALISESCAVVPSKEGDDVLTGAVGKENETGEESAEDTTHTDKLASQPANHLEKKRKIKSKKAKSLAEEESVPILIKNLEPIEVVDGEVADNVIRDVLEDSLHEKNQDLDKMENTSTKKSKKKHIEKIVESQVEVNSAALEEALPLSMSPKSTKKSNSKDTDALSMSHKNVAGDSEDNYLSNQILEVEADMGETFCPSQKDDVADKRQDHVIDVSKSKDEKKGLDMYHDGSVSSMKPKDKKARASVSSHLQSMVKSDRSGSKVDYSAEVSVDSKKEAVKNISNSFIDSSLSSMKPKEKKARASVTSHLQSVVKNNRSGSKVDHSAEVAVGSKKENFSNSYIDGSLSSTKPKEDRSSDVSSGTPSNSTLDDDDSDVNSMSRKQGNNPSAGGAKMSLVDILRRSASYKKAKLRADQSLAENKSMYDDDDEDDSLDKLSLRK